MAISWDLQITNVNLSSKRATVTATRTDDQSALPPQVYAFQNTPLENVADRAALLNTIKEKVEERADQNTLIETFLSDLEQTGKANLEAWEATR